MAKYTYEDFENAARKAGLYDEFSQADLELSRRNPEFGMSILTLKDDYRNARSDDMRALTNRLANALRRSYGGYSGGEDGSGYVAQSLLQGRVGDTLDKLGSYGSFTYDREEDYRRALDGVTAPRSFTWEPEQDPAYLALREQSRREGDRAMKNVLGQVSARTGGLASSYGVTAASQARDYYNEKLSDQIPELYRAAYDRYLQEGEQNRQSLSALQADRNQAYSRWQDGYKQLLELLSAQQDREGQEYAREYTRGRDAVADARYADETAYDRSRDAEADRRYYDALRYDRGRDAVADARYADETAYDRSRDAEADRRYYDALAYDRSRDALADARYADETAWARGTAAGQEAYSRARDQAEAARQTEKTAYDRLLDAIRVGIQTGNYALADALVESYRNRNGASGLTGASASGSAGTAAPMDKTLWEELKRYYPEEAVFAYPSYEDYLRDWQLYLAQTEGGR